jgi:hypothetical protein
MWNLWWPSGALFSHMKVFDPGVKSLVASTHERSDANVDAWATSGFWMRALQMDKSLIQWEK